MRRVGCAGEQGVGRLGTAVVLAGVECELPPGHGKHVGLGGRLGQEEEEEEERVSRRRFQCRGC